MSLLGKLFNAKPDHENEDEKAIAAAATESQPQAGAELSATDGAEPAAVPLPEADAAAPTPEETGIRAFDQYGREVLVPREEWRTNVLPGMLKEAWDQPDQLYMLVVNSLNDGFTDEVSDAAAHLFATDPLPARGACMWSIVLMQKGQLDEARQVLEAYRDTQPPDGSVLVNLAKVYAAQGDAPDAENTLWDALQVEPNLDNGLGWYAAMMQEKDGEGAAKAALERVAEMPTSWRAQLWLAREALERGDMNAARALYDTVLERAPKPLPPDLLMQLSGDLGGQNRLSELLEFTAPHYDPAVHGLSVGNNLIKAYVDLGDLDRAEQLKNTLFAMDRPDWKGPLGFWDAEIARRRALASTGTQPGQPVEVQVGMLRVDGPIWLPAGSPAANIFGTPAAGRPVVTFLGGTAEQPEQPETVTLEMADALGRLTRALPLYFAEQADLRAGVAGKAMLPWAVGQSERQPSGFVVSGQSWPDATAVQVLTEPANRSDYVVTVHIDAEVEPWTCSLAFIRTADGTRVGELEREFTLATLEDDIPTLADELVELLAAVGNPPHQLNGYATPAGKPFQGYLLRLEQLLAVRCATMAGVPRTFLSGEREILDGDLELALAEPDNIAVRLLLIETLSAMARVRPEVVEQFQPKFQRLIVERPLAPVDAAFTQAAGIQNA